MKKRYSKYELTGNLSLDIVAEAVGHAQHFGLSIKHITLNPPAYAVMQAGQEMLSKKPLPDGAEITFEGIPVRPGASTMIDRIRVEYRNHKPITS